MTTIAEVREALASACRIRATAYITDSVNTPVAVVSLNDVNYDIVMGRGGDEWQYTIAVYASRTNEKAAQKYLDDLREPTGDTSLKTLVEGDAGLAELVDYARVRTASPVRAAAVGQAQYLFVEFAVEIVY